VQETVGLDVAVYRHGTNDLLRAGGADDDAHPMRQGALAEPREALDDRCRAVVRLNGAVVARLGRAVLARVRRAALIRPSPAVSTHQRLRK
jgi:hypothetical protein